MPQDVFISYRRDGGEHLAGRIKNALKAKRFTVFMDVEDLKSGKFDTTLLRKIEAATDVIVILTPGCLDRCKSEDDWLRQEIRHAIKCERNIVPIMARNFQMPTVAGLPPDIAEFAKYNGLTPAHELFDANIDRLVSTFLKSVPASPKSTSRKRLRQATSSVRAADPRGRVFFNNGWDGFDPSKDDDVLFHFDLKNPRLVRHIAVLRQLKPGAYTAQGFIAAKPELLLDPLEGEARLSICFGSADDCRQAEADYNFFFDHYHPVLPEAVTLNVLDGNEEAMWEWSTKIPAEWLVSEKPYVRESEVKRMQRTIQMWIDAHNAEIDRLRKRPPGK